MSKHFLIRNLFLLFSTVLFSMRSEAQSVKDINSIVQKVLNKDFEATKIQYQDSVALNMLIDNISKCIINRNDSAILYSKQAIILAEKAGLPTKISIAIQKLGQYYMTKENFPEAINCFINALKIEEKRVANNRIADLLDELGSVYYYQEIFVKAEDYNKKALSIYKKLNDTIGIAKVLSHLGSLNLSHEYCEKRTAGQILNDCKIALDYFNQAIVFCEKKADLNGIANGNRSIGAVYNRMNQPKIALGYAQKALLFYQKNNDSENIFNSLYSMGFIYNRLQKYDQALRCFNESKEISLQNKYTDGIQYLYEAIAQTYDNQKDYKNSRDYYVKYMIIRDSIYNNTKSKQIFELETTYQAEKKQNEIDRLILIKQQRTLLIYILITTLVLVSLLSRLYFRNIRNKKIIVEQTLELKEKQLLELEKDRQLSAAKSVLQGEEAERSRLAVDLHDGLGGLLSGVKLNLSSMKENSIITSENLAHFNHALDLLDISITELRRVAHNLMPETLIHFGLRTALNDFIKQVIPEGLPVLKFNTFGEDLRFNKELEITIYRITQELINNVIKHAYAKQIDIQLFTEKDRVCVQVIDNGIGFEPERLDPAINGRGIKNIYDRVKAFNGRFEILSQPGKGTESTIEFLIS